MKHSFQIRGITMQRLKLSLLLLLIPIISFATSLKVQVEESPVRSTPSFFGDVVDKAVYGDSVELLKEQGAWRMVKAKKKSGWIHESTVLDAKVALTAGENVNSNASGKEIALAGKGFNPEVEKAYQAVHSQVSFDWINKMEHFSVKSTDVQKFIKQGKLQGAGL
jgi:hypothetical protein